ncbi:MAG: AAA family ATPase [Xanthomonadales bacterium]|jgi:predicted ATP-binding protein involved in virulence|nr:AAA family ATPase [Xanthomonadales bacterium]
MRLKQLRIDNYRCFESLQIDFHPQLTVLTAPNGGGKTTVLDAARVALWPFVKGFDLGSQAGKSANIQIQDVRLAQQPDGRMEPQLPSLIEAIGVWGADHSERNWAQARERVKAGTNTLGDEETKRITAHARELQQQVRDFAAITLPLISYLGTSRLWYEGRFTSVAEDVALNTSSYSRTSGYLNCLAYASSFKTFTAWYGWVYRSYREEQIRAIEQRQALSETGQRFATIIEVIQQAVDALVHEPTGWHRLEYRASQNQQLVMHHDRLGSIPVEMLSDGLRNTIAMVADLAFRACKLNPHLGTEAARQTPGIALIDEVDMFLHPSWQQTIAASLCKAFPKLQFIVTTHSPQVLSTVRREQIRVIGHDETGTLAADQPLAMTYGEPSGDVLHSVMHLDPQPPIAEKTDLQQLTAWVDQGQYRSPQAVAALQTLKDALGANHPQLLRIERSIRRQEALRE